MEVRKYLNKFVAFEEEYPKVANYYQATKQTTRKNDNHYKIRK